MNKYGAKKVQVGHITFDSQFEANVYLELRKLYAACEISVHHPVVIAKANDYLSRDWVHKVDFYVARDNWYIEAKGVRTEGYLAIVKALCAVSHSILNRYTVISAGKPFTVFTGCNSISFGQFALKIAQRKRAREYQNEL